MSRQVFKSSLVMSIYRTGEMTEEFTVYSLV